MNERINITIIPADTGQLNLPRTSSCRSTKKLTKRYKTSVDRRKNIEMIGKLIINENIRIIAAIVT